jgi:hypothetical protein
MLTLTDGGWCRCQVEPATVSHRVRGKVLGVLDWVLSLHFSLTKLTERVKNRYKVPAGLAIKPHGPNAYPIGEKEVSPCSQLSSPPSSILFLSRPDFSQHGDTGNETPPLTNEIAWRLRTYVTLQCDL